MSLREALSDDACDKVSVIQTSIRVQQSLADEHVNSIEVPLVTTMTKVRGSGPATTFERRELASRTLNRSSIQTARTTGLTYTGYLPPNVSLYADLRAGSFDWKGQSQRHSFQTKTKSHRHSLKVVTAKSFLRLGVVTSLFFCILAAGGVLSCWGSSTTAPQSCGETVLVVLKWFICAIVVASGCGWWMAVGSGNSRLMLLKLTMYLLYTTAFLVTIPELTLRLMAIFIYPSDESGSRRLVCGDQRFMGDMPPIMIHIPIYLEHFEKVVVPLLQRCIDCIHEYQAIGGTAHILVADDGLAICDETSVAQRRCWYRAHSTHIVYAARPPSRRNGFFKKASNMNHSMWIHDQLLGNDSIVFGSEECTFYGGTARHYDWLLLLDADSVIAPNFLVDLTQTCFFANTDKPIGYVQATMKHVVCDAAGVSFNPLFAACCHSLDMKRVIRNGTIAQLGFDAPCTGHNVLISRQAMLEVSGFGEFPRLSNEALLACKHCYHSLKPVWSEWLIAEDSDLQLRLCSAGYKGVLVEMPSESSLDRAYEALHQWYATSHKFSMSAFQLVWYPVHMWSTCGFFQASYKAALSRQNGLFKKYIFSLFTCSYLGETLQNMTRHATSAIVLLGLQDIVFPWPPGRLFWFLLFSSILHWFVAMQAMRQLGNRYNMGVTAPVAIGCIVLLTAMPDISLCNFVLNLVVGARPTTITKSLGGLDIKVVTIGCFNMSMTVVAWLKFRGTGSVVQKHDLWVVMFWYGSAAFGAFVYVVSFCAGYRIWPLASATIK